MTKRSKNNERIKAGMRSKRTRPDNIAVPTSGRRRRNRGRVKNVSEEELREEYSYVLKDLRRIFGLALAMFVLLIAANLLLPLLTG